MITLPLTKLPALQSIAYLGDQMLKCLVNVRHNGEAIFLAGNEYRVRPFDVTIQRRVRRAAIRGPDHDHVLTAREMAIEMTDDQGRRWFFISQRYLGEGVTVTVNYDGVLKIIRPTFSLEALSWTFQIDSPPDIAQANPEHYAYNLKFLEEFERIVNLANSP
jgi:hypothetical protein